MAFRFKVKQCDEKDFENCSDWSEFKILTTQIDPLAEKYEHVYLYARGTGLNNHNSSKVMIGDTKIIDHAYYQGLFLIVIDRITLKVKFKQSYNTIEGEGEASMQGFRSTREFYNETLYGNSTPFYYQEYKYDKDMKYVKVGPEIYETDKIYNRTDKYYNSN